MSGAPHIAHPRLDERPEFLVDGCPRCREYVDELGVHFDAPRWRAFWMKMVRVEWDNSEGYDSVNDRDLGRSLYLVSLGMHRAFGVDPRDLVAQFALTPEGLAASLASIAESGHE